MLINLIVINNTKYYGSKNSELATWNKELVSTAVTLFWTLNGDIDYDGI